MPMAATIELSLPAAFLQLHTTVTPGPTLNLVDPGMSFYAYRKTFIADGSRLP